MDFTHNLVMMFPLLAIFLTSLLPLNSFADSQNGREKRVTVFDDDENPRGSRQAANDGRSYTFPLVLPPYPYDKSLKHNDFGTCMLYIEGISVVVYASQESVKSKRDFSSAAAVIRDDGSSKYVFNSDSVRCFDRNNDTKKREFDFRITIEFPEKAVAMQDKDPLFSISKGLDFSLKFKVGSDLSWSLSQIEMLDDLVIKSEGWLKEDVTWLKTDASNAKNISFGSYANYNFACSSTPPLTFVRERAELVIGIVFNNIQLQAYNIIPPMVKDDSYRFTTNVNDCQGLFSVGSWMSIVVLLVLLGVLAFGYLMLNSVQTMDRFDDPKQRELIIKAKE